MSHGPADFALLASAPRQHHVQPFRVEMTERMREAAVRYEGLGEPVSLVRVRPRRRQRVAVLPASRPAVTPAVFGAAWAAKRAQTGAQAMETTGAGT